MAVEISDATELKAVENDLLGDYVLVNDIDIGGAFEPIGYGTTSFRSDFEGTFDGQGYIISNATMSYSSDDYIGLFARNEGTIQNLGVTNSSASGNMYVGVLTGWNSSNIYKCFVTGSAEAAVYIAGGIYGMAIGGEVEDCYSEVNTVAPSDTGSFAGRNVNSAIRRCYSIGTVTADADYGGFVGSIYNSSSDFADVGNYWDTETSSVSTSPMGTGKTTSQMQTQSTFSGWDFTDTWTMDGYPELQWSAPAPVGITCKHWNGSSWADGDVKIWNGSSWATPTSLKTWDGSTWN